MNSVRIQTGETERIEIIALDASLDPVTGKTDLLISIRRVSDDQFYDFNDDTFKAAGWTTRQTPLTEIDATNAPGGYYYDFDTSAITNETADDTYQIRVEQSPGTDVENLPQTGEIKVGQYVDDLDAPISDVIADIAALNDLSIADVQTALTNQGYTSARAALLDFLDAAISSRSSHSAADVDTTLSGTHGAGSWEDDDSAVLAAIAALNDLSIADVQTALDNQGYTSARAALLDNLDGTISSIIAAIGALNDLSIADVQTALTAQGYSSARAVLLDFLDVAISSRSSHAPGDVDIVLTAAHGAGPWTGDTAAAIDALLTSQHGAGSWQTLDDSVILAAIAALNDISIADVQTALTNQGYTSARAAFLDNLDDSISNVLTAIAALNDLSIADVQAAMTAQGYTSARAALLDFLDAAISSRSSHDAADVDAQLSGTHGAGTWEQADVTTLETDVEFIKDMIGGRWLIDESTNEMIFYKADNTTEVARFDLKDISGNPAFANVFERVRQ